MAIEKLLEDPNILRDMVRVMAGGLALGLGGVLAVHGFSLDKIREQFYCDIEAGLRKKYPSLYEEKKY